MRAASCSFGARSGNISPPDVDLASARAGVSRCRNTSRRPAPARRRDQDDERFMRGSHARPSRGGGAARRPCTIARIASKRRHQHDGEHPQPVSSRGDVAVQLELHGAQLLPCIDDVLARGVDRGALLRRDHRLGRWPDRCRRRLCAACAAASRCRPGASATPAGSGGISPPPRSASAFTRMNGRLVSPRERSPISASPPASVPIRLATNGPLSAERRRGLLAEEVG